MTCAYINLKIFSSAETLKENLLIITTALKMKQDKEMDDVIFEEFKGTGNMELQLDRNIDRRIYPTIDLVNSGTRRRFINKQERIKNNSF